MVNDGGVKLLEQISSTERKSKKTASTGSEEELAYQKLKLLLSPFILRRRKVDVMAQSLPPKVRKVEIVPFDDNTRRLYESILASHLKGKGNQVDSVILDASLGKHLFTALRKAANHPLLLRTRHTGPEASENLASHLHRLGYFGRDASCSIDLVRKELVNLSDFDIHCAALDLIDEFPSMRDDLSKFTLLQEDLFCSPKFKRLQILLPNLLKEGHR